MLVCKDNMSLLCLLCCSLMQLTSWTCFQAGGDGGIRKWYTGGWQSDLRKRLL